MGRTEEEEIGSILNSFDEPFFLDHLARLLHGETWRMSCAYKGSVSSSLVSRSAVGSIPLKSKSGPKAVTFLPISVSNFLNRLPSNTSVSSPNRLSSSVILTFETTHLSPNFSLNTSLVYFATG